MKRHLSHIAGRPVTLQQPVDYVLPEQRVPQAPRPIGAAPSLPAVILGVLLLFLFFLSLPALLAAFS